MKLGEAEPGFENAPGMLYLAGELYRAATNASLGLGDAAGRTKQLLSFEIEPAGEAGHCTAFGPSKGRRADFRSRDCSIIVAAVVSNSVSSCWCGFLR